MKRIKKKALVVMSAIMLASAVAIPFTQHNGVSIGEEVGATQAKKITKATMQTKANLNMRSSASVKGKHLLTIPKGTKVTTDTKVGTWYKVSYKGKTGFVSGSYLATVKAPTKATPKPKAKPAPKKVVAPKVSTAKQYSITASLNLRSGASTKYKTLVTIPKGKVVTYVSKSGSWYKVKYGSKTGYVSSKYLKAVAVKAKVAPKPTPKKVTPKPVPKSTSVTWMTQSQAKVILDKTLDNNQLVAYGKVLVDVAFINKSDAKAMLGIDSRSYFSSIEIKPSDFGQAEYDISKALLKKMDASILAFAETQLGVRTSDSKRMTSDIKKFTAYSKKDEKVLKTYSGKTYEFWQMGGLVMVEFKK